MTTNRNLLQAALDEVVPEGLRERLRETVTADDYEGVFSLQEVKEFAKENNLSIEQALLVLTKVAGGFAQPTISQFSVGAIVQGSSGDFYIGANLEFVGAALSFTLHAEQAATVNAWNHGEEGLQLLAVDEPPCGYCRQYLYEITNASNLKVLIEVSEKPVVKPLKQFLPEAFGPENLGVTEALMSPQNHNLVLANGGQDPVVQAALSAANHSYAPLLYTSKKPCYAGVAIETENGGLFEGRLAENAAFNPSLSPLEAAMTMRNFSAHREDPVTRVVLVQVEGTIADQASATAAVVATLPGSPDFKVYEARPSSS